MLSFRQGTFLSVHLYLHTGTLTIIQGICIKKRNQGLNTKFTIKQIVDGSPVLHTFPLFTPFIKIIKT